MSDITLPSSASSIESTGFEQAPTRWLETVFNRVADSEMRELPFFRPAIPVKACGFTLFEQQWVGCMLTPWMMSLLVLPGPGQRWQPRVAGERLALQLPCGNVTFIHSEIGAPEEIHQYLSCSLMSPIESAMTAEQALMLAEQSARMALSLPVVDADAPRDPARRALFRRRSA